MRMRALARVCVRAAGNLNETHRYAGMVLVVGISYSNYYAQTRSFLEVRGGRRGPGVE